HMFRHGEERIDGQPDMWIIVSMVMGILSFLFMIVVVVLSFYSDKGNTFRKINDGKLFISRILHCLLYPRLHAKAIHEKKLHCGKLSHVFDGGFKIVGFCSFWHNLPGIYILST